MAYPGFKRLAAGLTSHGALLWLLWPVEAGEFALNIEALVLFVPAFVFWIAETVAVLEPRAALSTSDQDDRLNELNADAEKLNQLMEIFNQNAYYHFNQTELQTYIRSDDIKPLNRLLRFREDDLLPFHNQELEKRYQEIAKQAEKYIMGLWALYSDEGDGRATWRPNSFDGYVSDERYAAVMSEKRRLNVIAWSMTDDWKKFLAFAKQELRGTSVPLGHIDQSQ